MYIHMVLKTVQEKDYEMAIEDVAYKRKPLLTLKEHFLTKF